MQDQPLLRFEAEAQPLLAVNGFAIVPMTRPHARFDVAYAQLEAEELPVFVTADSLLHLYHLFYAQVLKYLEVREFIGSLQQLLAALAETTAIQEVSLEGAMAEAARRNLAYLTVARALLDPALAIPPGLPEAAAELNLIAAHDRPRPSPLMNADCPGECDPCNPGVGECTVGCTCEDYSQYVPRGHYTTREELQRYFRAMMWIGRIGFRLGSATETRQAVLLLDALNRSTVIRDGQPIAAAVLWHRIYDVTSFLVGEADDLTFVEYQTAVHRVLGEEFELAALEDPATLTRLREELDRLRDPAILGGFAEASLDALEPTKGLRLMGQRFTPDSYVMGRSVWSNVFADLNDPAVEPFLERCGVAGAGCAELLDRPADAICVGHAAIGAEQTQLVRLLPRGLDVAAALGSARAVALLEPEHRFCGYPEQQAARMAEFAGYGPADWWQNAYWAWLHALRPLLESPPVGFPNFMRTERWATRNLNTVLASWAALRHDTILYVKQSYSGEGEGEAPPPPESFGYVEPVPQFYARLKELSAFTRRGLAAHEALPVGLQRSFETAERLLDRLTALAVLELENQPLPEGEAKWVAKFGQTLVSLMTSLVTEVDRDLLPPCPEHEWCSTELSEENDPLSTSLVADVHTSPATREVLEVGSGRLEWIVVAHSLPDGTIGAAIGPVSSYYEFGWPMNDRLTDEAWRTQLTAGTAPRRPAWLEEIRVGP